MILLQLFLPANQASIGHDYDSFIGYILGTGTNTCYIENNPNILKNKSLDSSKSQIINIESGNFSLAPRTDLDHRFDNATSNPGSHTFEKMISGGYFGPLCLLVLKNCGRRRVFTSDTASGILALEEYPPRKSICLWPIQHLLAAPLVHL